MRTTSLAFAALSALLLAACGINSVPTAEENAKAKWADVEAAFQERANLIPNLSAVVRSASDSEKEILTQVTEARSRATSINVTTDDLSDPAEFERFNQAQNQLTQALGQLRTIVEAYPELRSQQNYQTFMSQLEGQENRIRITIRDYNEAVRQYNTTIRTFPDSIGANLIHGAEPMLPYKSVTPGAEVAPQVEL